MASKITKSIRKLGMASFSLSLMASSACQNPEQVTVGNTDISVEDAMPTPEATPDGNAVCDPFGNDGAQNAQSGLKGKLFYLAPNLPRYQTVAEYQANGEALPNDLYFSQLNVPTRPFDQGFMTLNGTVLETPHGDTLYEWFSVHFESELRLRANDEEGLYQFAVLRRWRRHADQAWWRV